jgi:2-methylcitrate dehydratase PrpD
VEDGPRILLRVPGIAEASGPSLIFASNGAQTRWMPRWSMATPSHALDYADVSGVLGGHPLVMLIPPMLALAELVGASGRDLALAYVVGFETQCRIARRAFPSLRQGLAPDRHPGDLGTVAAAARLLRLTAEQTAVAIGLAASLASGVKANFGRRWATSVG